MTCAVNRLPEVQVRLMGPADKDGLQRGFGCLSKRSVLLRFNSPIKALTPGQLRYLTEMDNRRHLAVCANISDRGDEFGIAVARYVAVGDRGDTAEFALTVIDDYQNRGVGTMLLEELVRRARLNGIRTFRGHVRGDNRPMLHILARYSPRLVRDGGLYRADINL